MIEMRKASIAAGDFLLSDVSFTIPTGSYAVLMGRSGQGKTTILESICGVRKIVAGSIWVDDVDVTHFLPGDRQIGYVPQDLALFPTMTVRQHLDFAQRIRRFKSDEIATRTESVAQQLGITHLLSRGIRGLSGGEAQRVALGRAMSFYPRLLILDEPLSALDFDTRQEMYNLLRMIRQSGVTTMHVTHNREEAESLADLRLEIIDGQVQSSGLEPSSIDAQVP